MSDGFLRKRQWFGDNSGSLTVLATGTTSTLLTCKTNYTIHVQRITIQLTTSASGKTWTIQDSASSPVPITGALPCDTAPATFTFDFGPDGVALTAGKNLVLSISAANAAGVVTWDAYMKLSATIDVTQAS